MTGAPDRWSVTDDFDDEDTDGAARFEQATRAAQALAALPDTPPESPTPDPAPPSSAAAPLRTGRVVLLVAVMVLTWLGFMVWDTWG
jgi:ferric-dicitrate binding protein FerR (iron transport regulator)